MDNYETQLKLMTEICYEYEQENIEDTDKIRADRMDRLMNCMQKIQACGYPPEDLVGALPPGWSLDSKSGLPKAVDMSKAAEACSIIIKIMQYGLLYYENSSKIYNFEDQ
uniref:Peroxin-19 n=1 Tax=Romanomermis culicivorax TaxID=13658 RepID=A0A915JBU3_ROMCU